MDFREKTLLNAFSSFISRTAADFVSKRNADACFALRQSTKFRSRCVGTFSLATSDAFFWESGPDLCVSPNVIADSTAQSFLVSIFFGF